MWCPYNTIIATNLSIGPMSFQLYVLGQINSTKNTCGVDVKPNQKIVGYCITFVPLLYRWTNLIMLIITIVYNILSWVVLLKIFPSNKLHSYQQGGSFLVSTH